ncbi:(2Fe-2S) ferredoxin domain-containing protein [Candidatus Peregrinibacteria bacterium]|nr:(2Fe-2S) ferredoxin domain-containing protein [Candidatus Peregrinibacteria bacterium]
MENEQNPFPHMLKKKKIRVCRSQKSCERNRAKYIWERICNELEIDPNSEKISMGNLSVEPSGCQGNCKYSPNIQVVDEETGEVSQFVDVNPIEAAKILKKLLSGISEKGISRKGKDESQSS